MEKAAKSQMPLLRLEFVGHGGGGTKILLEGRRLVLLTGYDTCSSP